MSKNDDSDDGGDHDYSGCANDYDDVFSDDDDDDDDDD